MGYKLLYLFFLIIHFLGLSRRANFGSLWPWLQAWRKFLCMPQWRC